MSGKSALSFVIPLLLLCSCSTDTKNAEDMTIDDMAAGLVEELDQDSSVKVKSRIVKGMLFEGEDIVENACVYMSEDEGNSDFVGVFETDDPEVCIEYLQEWLLNQKNEMQIYYPSQVFKISNAVMENNDDLVILIICEDIEQAKVKAAALLD